MYVRMYVFHLFGDATFPAHLIFNDLTTLITALFATECEF
jgi:hypothetical protein